MNDSPKNGDRSGTPRNSSVKTWERI